MTGYLFLEQKHHCEINSSFWNAGRWRLTACCARVWSKIKYQRSVCADVWSLGARKEYSKHPFYFLRLCAHMCICVRIRVGGGIDVPGGTGSSWTWKYCSCEPPEVSARTQTQVLCKDSTSLILQHPASWDLNHRPPSMLDKHFPLSFFSTL